jgi:hypothetical protein
MKQLLRISRASVIIAIILLYVAVVYAHEEPAKTLKEKADRRKAQEKTFASKIKSLTAWNYVVQNDSIGELKSKTIVQEYDTIGNFIGISAFKNDTLNERAVYRYTEGGDLSGDEDYSSRGQLLEHNIYRYDGEGRVVSGESRNNTNLLTGRFEYTRDRNGSVIEFRKFKMDGSVDYTIKYMYDENCDSVDVAVAVKYDSAGKQALKVENKYDTRRQLIEKHVTDNDDASTFTYYYGYDKKDNLVEVRKIMKGGKTDWRKVYAYDFSGNRIEVQSYNDTDVLQSYQKYSYEYYK